MITLTLRERWFFALVVIGTILSLNGCDNYNGNLNLPDGATRNDYLSLDAIWPLGLGYADSSINVSIFRQHSILRLDNETHVVAYYDENGDVRIDAIDLMGQTTKSMWIVPRLESRLIGNGHAVISLGRSTDGRIHVIYGAHATTPYYAVFDESLLRDASSARVEAAAWRHAISYPQFYNVDDTLQFWFRSHPERAINRTIYDQQLGDFSLTSETLLTPGDAKSIYMNELAIHGQHLALTWLNRMHSDDTLVRNEGLFLVRSDDGGRAWNDWNGRNIEFPLSRGEIAPVISLPDSDQPLNQTGSTIGADGRLYVTYYAHDSRDVHQIHLAIFDVNGVLEESSVVSKNLTRFDLQGSGTLALPLSRPQIAVSENFQHVVYRQSDTLVIASRRSGNSTDAWSYLRMRSGSLGAWEPTISRDTWMAERRLMVFVQDVRQGEADTRQQGPPTPVEIYVFHEAR